GCDRACLRKTEIRNLRSLEIFSRYGRYERRPPNGLLRRPNLGQSTKRQFPAFLTPQSISFDFRRPHRQKSRRRSTLWQVTDRQVDRTQAPIAREQRSSNLDALHARLPPGQLSRANQHGAREIANTAETSMNRRCPN